MKLAEDVTAGSVDPAALNAELVQKCRELIGRVVGEGDPLFEPQVAVANQALATGAVPATTLREWAAVLALQHAQGSEILASSMQMTTAPVLHRSQSHARTRWDQKSDRKVITSADEIDAAILDALRRAGGFAPRADIRDQLPESGFWSKVEAAARLHETGQVHSLLDHSAR